MTPAKPSAGQLADRFSSMPSWYDSDGVTEECKLGVVTVAERDLIVAALRAQPSVRLVELGPCTQAELDEWEIEKHTKTGKLLLMWMDRALKAEAALAHQPRSEGSKP